MDARFVIPPRGKDCLNCKHHGFDLDSDDVTCNHPQRPDTPVKVVKWTAGCPQHEDKQ